MQYITAANIIIWSSLYAYVMPSSIDSELSSKGNVVAIHKIEHTK